MGLGRSIDTAGLAPLALVLMGVSGSGKTTVGARLAGMLRGPFLEGDDFHDDAAVAKMRAGDALTDEDRWPWLDRIGAATRVAVRRDGIAVVACSALRRAYRDRLARAAGVPVRFAMLALAPDELARRVADRPGHYMPASLLASQLATLEPPEAGEAAITLDAAPPAVTVCREVLAWLQETASDGPRSSSAGARGFVRPLTRR